MLLSSELSIIYVRKKPEADPYSHEEDAGLEACAGDAGIDGS